MSRDIFTVVLARALQLWTPEHRCIGILRRKGRDSVQQYCAVGVLQQARKDCGISGRQMPLRKLVKKLGYNDIRDLIATNDQMKQDEIYATIADYVKNGP